MKVKIFSGCIYKNTGQTMTWKGRERASGDGSAQDDDLKGHQFE